MNKYQYVPQVPHHPKLHLSNRPIVRLDTHTHLKYAVFKAFFITMQNKLTNLDANITIVPRCVHPPFLCLNGNN